MLRIHLFGPLRLEIDDAPHRFAALPKTLPLLAYLLLHRAATVPRATVAFTLWPDLDEESAQQSAPSSLRDAAHPAVGAGRPPLGEGG